MSRVTPNPNRRQPPPRHNVVAAARAAAAAAAANAPATTPESTDAAPANTEGDPPTDAGAPAAPKEPRPSGLPAHLRKASVVRRLASRVKIATHGKGVTTEEGKRTSLEMDGWADDADLVKAREQLDQAVALMIASAKLLEDKGPEFDPMPAQRRRGPRQKIEKGTKVRLREKFRDGEKGYGDLLTPAEMDNLEVVDVRGQKLVLKTPDGGKLFLPRGNVQIVTADGTVTDEDDGDGDGDGDEDSED